MNVDNPFRSSVARGLCSLTLATALAGALAAETPELLNLDQARARIAALEARVAELEAALSVTTHSEPAAEPAAVSKPEEAYRVDPTSERFRFLNLGVRKSYIAAERKRLIDQLHTMIPPLYEPAFSPFHGYTLPSRAFRVAVNNDRFINHADFGRDKFYALFFDNAKVENQIANVDLSYGLTDNDTLRLVLPFNTTTISGTGKAFRIRPMEMTMNGHAFGFGDVQFMAKHKWFDQAVKPFNLATVFGVQFPTGQDDNRFNDAQNLFMNGMPMPVSGSTGGPKVDLFSDDERIPNSVQPGTGAWGALAGVMATRQLTWNHFRGALHGGALYKAMRRNENGVRPGNELTFSASFVRPPARSEHFTFDLTFFGRNKQSERFPGLIMHPEPDANGMPIMNPDGSLKMFVTPRPPFEHGTVAFLSPSLVILPKSALRLTVSPMFRIYEPNQGPSPAFRIVFGATTTF
jgi:Putative MetA-pathway of phenol degradation